MRRSWLIIGAIVSLLLIVLARALFFAAEDLPALVTATAEIADIESTVLASGTVEASELVSVGAQVSGQVVKLHVALGAEVSAGQLIAEIDSVPQQNALRNAEAALASQRANRAVQVANFRQAELGFERQSAMLAEDATARADYESAEATLAVTRAQIKALDAQIVQATTALDTARTNLAYTRITAPMSGTVVAVVTKEGQTVNANQSTPTIVKLAKLDIITVSTEISEADITRVAPGQAVYFTILGEAQQRYNATLRMIEPAPDSIASEGGAAGGATEATNSAIYYNGLFDVPNRDRKLRVSMTAQVHIVLDQAKAAVTIPASAVERNAQGETIVRVVAKDGRTAERRIDIGINNKVAVQVLSGLQRGEEVVIGEAAATPSGTPPRRRGPMGF